MKISILNFIYEKIKIDQLINSFPERRRRYISKEENRIFSTVFLVEQPYLITDCGPEVKLSIGFYIDYYSRVIYALEVGNIDYQEGRFSSWNL